MYSTLQTTDDNSIEDINIDNPNNNPEDTVSSIQWFPNPMQRIFAVSSWDSKIKLYDVFVANMYQKCIQFKGFIPYTDPILSISWQTDGTMLFAGCADNKVIAFDINTQKPVWYGQHDAPVKDVFWMDGYNLLLSISFDKTIKLWQVGQQQPAITVPLDHKIFIGDQNQGLILIGLANEKILLLDVKKLNMMQKPPESSQIESPLGVGSQTTSLMLFPQNDGFGLGSCDGRANLSSIVQEQTGQVKFNSIMTFKCHKTERSGITTFFPVHCIGFHPKANKFLYTAGGDGVTNYWDYEKKNKIKTFQQKNIPVTRARISPDGQFFAQSLGYDWSKGIWGLESPIANKIVVHIMNESELKST